MQHVNAWLNKKLWPDGGTVVYRINNATDGDDDDDDVGLQSIGLQHAQF